MSTTIYNGYRLPAGLTMDSVFQWLPDVRQRLRAVVMEEWAQTQIRLALELRDKELAHLAGIAVTSPLLLDHQSPLGTARCQLLDTLRETQKEGRRYHLDPDTSLCVFPSPQGLFALLFTCSSAVREEFLKIEGVSEFNYYDNVDGPDTMSEREWKARGRLWDELLGPSGVPAERGATFQLISPDYYYLEPIPETAKQGNMASLRSIEYRARLVAFSTPSSALPEDLAAEAAQSASLAIHSRHLRDLEKGKVPVFNQECEKIQGVLPLDVSFEELREEKRSMVARLAPCAAPGPRP